MQIYMEGARFLKLRNVKVAKRLGTKTLAGLLAFGLVVGTPSVVLADVQTFHDFSGTKVCMIP